MRLISSSAIALALLVAPHTLAQAQTPAAPPDAARAVSGGGISVPGWQGKIDANEEKAGLTIDSAKFMQMGSDLHVTTGPASTYWNPKNTASGNYTVKATFTEPKFQALNDHPHPYGIVIAGNDLGTAQQSYLYCAAYGTGTFIVRGFGPTPFQMGGRQPTAHAAVNKAGAKDQPVTQEIAISVKDNSVDCIINGQTVATYPKAEVVGAGKLKSTDGVYGVRFGHNTEAMIKGLTVTKP